MIFVPGFHLRKIDFGTHERLVGKAVTLTKMNWTIITTPCESLRMTAREKTIRPSMAPGRRAHVIVFPIFESYGDQLAECLAALGERKPTRTAVRRVTQSLRRALPDMERVRNSARHANMACMMRHTLEALRACEWQGARYLLMTGSALMHARAVRPGVALNGPDAGGVVLQFPLLPAEPSELITGEAITGMITG